jgi:hypothetical protein
MIRSVIVVVITAAMLYGNIGLNVGMIVEKWNVIPRDDGLDAISV